MDFACELMDLCRGTQEVEAVLSESGDDGENPLERLKMAMEYEEKKVRVMVVGLIAFTMLRKKPLIVRSSLLQFVAQHLVRR